MQSSTFFPAIGRHSLDCGSSFYSNSKGSPFVDSFPDPLCKLNLKETSDFVKAFPMTNKCSSGNRGLLEDSCQRRGLSLMGQRRIESPSAPGRPLFSFSPWHLHRKNIPSKWDDAEKWLINSSCHESPAHVVRPTDSTKSSRQIVLLPQKGVSFAEKQMSVAEKKPPISPIPSFDGPVKETSNEGFLSKSSYFGLNKDTPTAGISEVLCRDIGTEMTPSGSSMTTRYHTSTKSSSPARHNTPADGSGPLVPCNTFINITELNDCYFAKLKISAQYDSIVSNWSSREEEEEEVSKSLKHLEISNGRKSIGVWACAREEEEKTKRCIRYQREEAKIQAWLNLQIAKAEARSRKLEVKIQKMRSNLEEKLMGRMATVHRRAEEWRTAAQQQHTQQLKRASEHAQKMKSQHSSHISVISTCGCFPCNNHL